MKKDPTILVRHMLESISQIEDYVTGMDRSRFLEQKGVQDSVIRRLEALGEAAKNLPGMCEPPIRRYPGRRSPA